MKKIKYKYPGISDRALEEADLWQSKVLNL
jgi:hypothetical protein